MNRSLTRSGLALGATTTLVAVLAAPASAVVTVYSGGSVYGDAADDSISVACTGGTYYASGVTVGQACADLTGVNVYPQGGTDTVDLSGVTAADFPGVRYTYTGLDDSEDDTFTGSPLSDQVLGDSGDSVSTGAGDDRIEGAHTAVGGFGDDVISDVAQFASGGPGDDRFVQTAPLGGVEGGEGFDTWEIDFDLDTIGPPFASIVLDVSASALTLSVPGTPTTQSVPISSLEHIEATVPRTVPSTWNGSAFPGTQNVRGFSRNDVLVGGASADVLSSGAGDDTITGGAGRDQLVAGAGNDTVNARDGEVDTIFCGDGTDTVVADAGDVVADCESVQLPAAPPPPVVTPPAPAIPDTGTVRGKASVDKPAKATFRFSSPTTGATFQCKLDKGRWKSCTSPHKVATKKLKVGKHTLRVRAVLAGVVDPTPSVRKFRVTR